MKKNNIVFLAIFLVLLCVIFKNWFLSPNIVGGDWPFFPQQYVNQFSFLPPIWNSAQGDGLGGQSIIYATDSYLYFTGWLFSVILHIPWNIANKIVWYGLFLALSSWSSIYLFKTVFPKSPFWQTLLSALLYTTNTYILLVVGGGQIPSANAYALAPFLLARFIILQESLYDKPKRQVIWNSLLAGLVFSLQIVFDLRFAYITMCGILLYLACCVLFKKRQILSILVYILAIPLGISILFHMYWILPIILTKSNPASSLGNAYTSLTAVKYFSFATFENALGLLHPYWPENIFGKVAFMKPEYLVLPIVAFSSLLFLNSKLKTQKSKAHIKGQKFENNVTIEQFNNRYILYFALLGLLGAFLAKGANDPFGGIYLWLFGHIPGFVLFRDSTKFYLLIAISYSVLIPYAVWSIYEWIKQRKKFSIFNFQFLINSKIFNFQNAFVIIFVLFWLFTIRQAVFGQLNGTFARHEVPTEYAQLRDMLINDHQFSRTLWLPKLDRYGYYDQIHPAVEGSTALEATTSVDMIKDLQKKNAEKQIQDLSIKYVVVPFDAEKEIFLKDRKYNPDERNMIIAQLQKIPWLTRDKEFKEIAVYTLKNSKDKFWMNGTRKVSSQKISDTAYTLTVTPGSAEKLIFDESYNPYWIALSSDANIEHGKFDKFNSYDVSSNKKAVVINLHYVSAYYYVIGRIISLLTLIAVVYILLKFT